MKKTKKGSFFDLTTVYQDTENVHSLENNLIAENQDQDKHKDYQQYEKIYLESKALSKILAIQKQKKEEVQVNFKNAKKRIANLRQLQDSVDKQMSYMKMQTQKISDVYKINKILMMEKVVKMQREAEYLQNKKDQCEKIRAQKMKSSALITFKKAQRSQYAKLRSLNETQLIKKDLNQIRAQTMEMKRRRADSIRSQQERRREKSRKIEQFKQDRAKSNYFNKLLQLKNDIMEKQNALNLIETEQMKEQKRVNATQKVANEYFSSFFATQDATL